jgi:hypothetical protein
VPVEGVEAKLSIAIHPPAAQSRKAPKMRGLKKADWELIFLRIGVGRLDSRQGDFVVRASRHKWMLLMRNWPIKNFFTT